MPTKRPNRSGFVSAMAKCLYGLRVSEVSPLSQAAEPDESGLAHLTRHAGDTPSHETARSFWDTRSARLTSPAADVATARHL
jgi:hypothetical protein